jgi:carboxypeptidase family protein
VTLQIASVILVGTLVASQPAQAVTQMSRVSGQVIEDGTDTPVADAHVFVVLDDERAAPHGSLPEALSDRDGRYQFDTLTPGRYHIAAQKDGFAPPMDPSTMQIFDVAAGQVLDGLTVFLRRGGAFAGRVLDPQRQPIANVGVTALLKRLNRNDQPAGVASSGPPLLMPSGQGQTNDLGEFRIFGLWPGEYVIVATAQSKFGAATQPAAATTTTATYFPGTADVFAAQPVAVQSDETVSDLIIPLVSVAAFKVSGVVVDAGGAPVANAMVMLMGGQRGIDLLLSLVVGPPLMSQSDAEGRFTLGDVPAGAYTLRADAGIGAGIGAFGFTDTFGIDVDGTPRGDPSRPKPAREPGTIEVTVDNADVSDLRIVVTGLQ